MSRIELAPEVSDDFDRILEHLERYDVIDAPARTEEIIQGLAVLEYNPLYFARPMLRLFGRLVEIRANCAV